MTIQALLFGGIGTLLETSELQREAFNAAFREAGLDWHWDVDEYRQMLSEPGGAARIAAFALQQGDTSIDQSDAVELHARKTALFHERIAAGGLSARPGVVRLVRHCQGEGVALGFATTTDEAIAHSVLSAVDLAASDFDVIMHRGLVHAAKPDGEVYRTCLASMNVAPEAALAIEDSSPGLRAATAAGVACIVTPGVNTLNHDYDGALTVVSHLGDAGQPYRWLGGRQPGTVEVIELEPWCHAA